MPDSVRRHILSVLVENCSGVLARVAGLFSRRGYNILSLTVAPTDDERFSRITVVVDVDSAPLEQIVKQLHKLINVIRIVELDPADALERELLMVTVAADPDRRGQIMDIVQLFGGSVVEVSTEHMTVSVADEPAKLDSFEDLIRGYGIVELHRSGQLALPRLSRRPQRLKSLPARSA